MDITERFMDLIQRSGLKLAVCGYCSQVCLENKRSLCCGDATYDDGEFELQIQQFLDKFS